METKNIGLVGRGKFGSVLNTHFENEGIQVDISEGRGRNAELAERSDVLIISVPPKHVEEVMLEIRDSIHENLLIISFAAAVAQEDMKNWSGCENIVRAMTELGAQQVIVQRHTEASSLLGRISKDEVLETDNEEDVDVFTVTIGCLPGIAAWQFVHNAHSADTWLHEYGKWVHQSYGIAENVVKNVIAKAKIHKSSEELLTEVATKGGITEAIVKQLDSDCDSSFAQLIEAGMVRTQILKTSLGE